MEIWQVIDDTKIRHVWRCADCGEESAVVPWDYMNIGTPYCADCDEDMQYLSTEMNNG
jgi:formylmethanofuran dehydrogenase subunit E